MNQVAHNYKSNEFLVAYRLRGFNGTNMKGTFSADWLSGGVLSYVDGVAGLGNKKSNGRVTDPAFGGWLVSSSDDFWEEPSIPVRLFP